MPRNELRPKTQRLLLWHILSSPFSRPERLVLIPVLKVRLIVTANAVEHLCFNHCAEHLIGISAPSNPRPSLGGGSRYLHKSDEQTEAQRVQAIARGQSWRPRPLLALHLGFLLQK